MPTEEIGEVLERLNPSIKPLASEPESSTGSPKASWQTLGYWSIKAVNARMAEVAGAPSVPVCGACGGIGYVKNVEGADTEYPCGTLVKCMVCGERQRKQWLARNCGLEGKLLDVRLSNWRGGEFTEDADKRDKQRRRSWLACTNAVKTRHGIYTFWGDFGSGKTHALATICNELRDRLIETYYAPMASVLDHLSTLYGQKTDTSEYWQRLLDIPVLAIDEVTRFNATDWAREKLFVLVDTRYRRRGSHLTMFATNDDPNVNVPPDDPVGYVYSRMRESHHVIELRGDMRAAVSSWAVDL